MQTYAADGRTAAYAPAAPAPATPSMVADQLDALLGEHLMPLRVRSGNEDAPHLLAVDASGEPVVVEIVALLDEDAVIRALRHAGRAALMDTAELAASYGGGAERYAAHLAAFRLTVPSTALLSTFVRGGARLLIVCSHIAPGIEEVLEFLLQPGWQVDVLRAEVVGQPDGSRVVELSPVSRSAAPERAVDRPSWARDVPAPPDEFDPTPLFRARVAEAGYRSPSAAPSSQPRPAPYVPQTTWSAPTAAPVRIDQLPGEAPRSGASARPVPADRVPIDRVPNDLVSNDLAPGRQSVRPSQVISPALVEPRQGWPWPPDNAAELLEQTNPTWAARQRPAPLVVPPSFAVPVSALGAERPDPALAAVADVLDGPVVLVWCPLWATECYEALLHDDGTLETADGTRYGDVETMTRAISGYTGPLDAWQAWHVDSPAGPSLAVLAAEVFPDQF